MDTNYGLSLPEHGGLHDGGRGAQGESFWCLRIMAW
jgi:hypothetical protein